MVTKEAVEKALRDVYDPELGINIVDLGLIYGIDIEGEAVKVTMTLTTQGCPLHDSMARGARQAVERLPEVREAEVEVVWDPPWTPERLSPGARRQLGWASQDG